MQHFKKLTENIIRDSLDIGEDFTYETPTGLFRKGKKVSPAIMIPIGLLCETLEGAQGQS
jgi:hypothetical protein